MKKWIPSIVAGLCAVWAFAGLNVPASKPGGFDFRDFGRLPVVSNGRTQPLDSLARNALLQLREKQSANLEPWKAWYQRPQILSATEWLAGMMLKPEVADTWPVIRINNPDLLGLLGLPANADPEKQVDGKHFSWNAIKGKLGDLQREGHRAGQLDQSRRTPYDQALVRMMECVGLYMRLQNTVQPQNAKDWPAELGQFVANAPAGVKAYNAQQEKKPHDEAALERFMRDISRFDVMARLDPALIIPPAHPERNRTEWMRTVDALVGVARGDGAHFALNAYARMTGAYRTDNFAKFNDALGDYRTALTAHFQPELAKASREQRFNFFEPFYKSMNLYVLAFLGALGFWFAPQRMEGLRRTAAWMVGAALLVHTTGLIFRMVLEGRPPVTNLYSSAIFIGWGACILGLILERFWRNSIGIVVSSTIGFTTLIIAHHLSLTGDTMEMMRAVLDTNFWLATHVVVVTLGYSATFVAGFLALIYLLRGLFTRSLDAGTAQSLAKMVYGIVCFGTLFSFVGTVLGGIWADQSWGRFWGWDPKENGALIIVLWNALILHARWGGLVRERGLMNLAIGGNIVTAWSWFGVNMLGIGLHSYGFMDSAFMWLMLFVVSQLALVALGCLPVSIWRSSAALGGASRGKPLPV